MGIPNVSLYIGFFLKEKRVAQRKSEPAQARCRKIRA
jgi:hypothetical protein